MRAIHITDMTSSDRYTVSTLCEKGRNGIRATAFCPICDKAEESHDHRNDEKQALIISIGKIRIHMRLIHRVNNAGGLAL